MRPSGWFMSVTIAVVGTCIRRPVSTSERASAWASVARLHERAAAPLHVEHQRVEPFGQLLAHDARGDQRDRRHGRRHVAERVELAVGGHEVGRRAADHAADAARDGLHFLGRQIRCGSRESLRACRACRRWRRGRGRRSSAPADRNRPSSGASGSETLSPMPPVECLSTLGDSPAGHLSVAPEWSMCSVRAAVSATVMPRKIHRHRPGGHLVVGNVALGVGIDERTDLEVGELVAVALLRDEVDDVHGVSRVSRNAAVRRSLDSTRHVVWLVRF